LNYNIIPLILAGGVGERFWPWSTSSKPKQLLALTSEKTLIEETLLRQQLLISQQVKPLIVGSAKIASAIQQTLGEQNIDYIFEPCRKNTAPAIGLAAAWLQNKYGICTMLIASSDHAIRPIDAYVADIKRAAELAQQAGRLVIFGIPPTRPDPGFGYIKCGERIKDTDGFAVELFTEKPSIEKARTYYADNRYLWNSGMFVWRTDTILDEFKRQRPALFALIEQCRSEQFSEDAINRFYHAADSESIDYAIMEGAQEISVVRASFKWDDVGSWDAMTRLHGLNNHGTTTYGKKIVDIDSRDAIIINDSNATLASFGVHDIALIASEGAVVAIARSELPRFKEYLAKARKLLPDNLL